MVRRLLLLTGVCTVAIVVSLHSAGRTPLADITSRSADEYVRRGKAFFDAGRDYEAIEDYTAAIRLDPRHAAAHCHRGLAYLFSTQNRHRAISDLTRAIELKPDFPEAYWRRGMAYERRRNYDRALADYTSAIRLRPDWAEAYRCRGCAYAEGRRDHRRAIRDFTRAIELEPENADAYENRAQAYADTGQRELAIADHRMARKLDPETAGTHPFQQSKPDLPPCVDRLQGLTSWGPFLRESQRRVASFACHPDGAPRTTATAVRRPRAGRRLEERRVGG